MIRWLALVLLALAVTIGDARAQGAWVRAESPSFIVFSTASEVRVREMAADLEAFDALLRRMTGAPQEPAPTKLEVYVFRGPGQLAEVWPGMSTTIRGVYSADVDMVAAFAIYRDTYGLEAQDVLFHEYAHHFMYQYFANAYPSWYVEGFAEFVSTVEFEAERTVLGRSSEGRAASLFQDTWLPMQRLLAGPTRGWDAQERGQFYAQAWLFTHYIFTNNRNEQFLAYLRAMRLGAPAVEAFETGFAMTPDEMQSELRAYLRRSPSALALTRPAPVAASTISVSRLPASADRLLPLSARVRRGVSSAGAEDLIADVRDRIRGAPADRFALLTLAHAEAIVGDVARARALLEPHLAQSPDDAQALYLQGYTYLREARAEKAPGEEEQRARLHADARRFFVRAHRADENHVPTLYRYAETFAGQNLNDAEADSVLNSLLLARQLAPQVEEIGLYTASTLIWRGRPAEAIPILRAIAYNPHAGSSAEPRATCWPKRKPRSRRQISAPAPMVDIQS